MNLRKNWLATGCRPEVDSTHKSPGQNRGSFLFFTKRSVDAAWDSNALGGIARDRGFSRIDHADPELLSIPGIRRQYTVHVHGL